MVRTIKASTTRTLTKGERAILLPGSTRAEPWELWALGKDGAECLQTFAQPVDNRLRQITTLALPVAQVFCVPLWLNEKETNPLAGMIPLQLELRGLQPRAQESAVFEWSVVMQENDRTLVIVGVLPPNLSREIQAEFYSTFDLSVRYLPLAEDALTLWLEHDHLVCAITRGHHLVYFQSLPDAEITTRLLQDLICVRSVLESQRVIKGFERVVVWIAAKEPELASLRQTFQVPIISEDRPSPQAPTSVWNLVPATVSRARETRKAQRWQRRGFLLALVLYLVFTAWMVTNLFLLNTKVNELNRWQAQESPNLSLIHETQVAWKDLGPVVDEKDYPLELLLHCAGALPGDQLHLTLFEAEDGHLLIKGEAKNVSAAFQFLDQLKRDPYLSSYTWVMGQPQILPNDLAQLQIDGTRGPASF
jgi:hypothetical protein